MGDIGARLCRPRLGRVAPAKSSAATLADNLRWHTAYIGFARTSRQTIGNIIVMGAAIGVWGTATAWPDLLVAAIMAGIFFTSSMQILRQAWTECREGSHPATAIPAE